MSAPPHAPLHAALRQARPAAEGNSRLAGQLAWLVAAVVALAPPVAYFSLGYSALQAEVDTKAQIKAELVGQVVSNAPDMWQFEQARVEELLERMPRLQPGEEAAVTADTGVSVAQSPRRSAVLWVRGQADLFDAGVRVGQVEVKRSLHMLLGGTLLALLAGLLLASGVVGVLRLLRRREQAIEAAMRDEQERARVTLHSIGDAVITTDLQGGVDYMNPVAERLLMTSLADARGHALHQLCPLVHETSRLPLTHPVHQVLPAATGLPELAPPDAPAAVLRRDGSTLPIQHQTAPIRDQHGHTVGAVMVFHDLTTVRRMAQRISWGATHDALTGLVNRRELEARVSSALLSARNSGLSHVVCMLNLDQFKLVNDSCGHAAGDALLKQVGRLLQSRLREADTLARLDGDSFGVLLAGCGLDAAERIAISLLAVLRDNPFAWAGKTFQIGGSMGLVLLDTTLKDRTQVLATAEAGCSAAKEQGGNQLHVVRQGDAAVSQRLLAPEWAPRLSAALADNRFTLYFQRYQSLQTPAGAAPARQHVEILLRLLDEQGRTVPPGEFLPAAERYNLMPAIDRWVISQVFERYADLACQLGNEAGLTCAVNLSGASLNVGGLLEHIQAQAELHALPPGAVCFEITETAAVLNLQQAAQFMEAVKALGFSFALDDFGVGSSSFGYLKHLPVDMLKIDGGFVRNIVHDPVDRAMVDTIHRVGQIMGLKTVAEFAETTEAIQLLRELGVDYAQGYGVHRPEPLPGALMGALMGVQVGVQVGKRVGVSAGLHMLAQPGLDEARSASAQAAQPDTSPTPDDRAPEPRMHLA